MGFNHLIKVHRIDRLKHQFPDRCQDCRPDNYLGITGRRSVPKFSAFDTAPENFGDDRLTATDRLAMIKAHKSRKSLGLGYQQPKDLALLGGDHLTVQRLDYESENYCAVRRRQL